MTTKNIVLIIIAIAALGGAGYMFMINSGPKGPAEESMDRPVYLVCSQCSNEFELTMREYNKAVQQGGLPECPECGSRKVKQAAKCPACDKLVLRIGHAELPPTCPHCGEPFTRIPDRLKETQQLHEELNTMQIDGG